MKKIYFLIFTVLFFCTLLPKNTAAQTCAGFTATYTAYESRCAATGSIKVRPAGGSGTYKYKVTGQVNINFTSADSITGLSAGTYSLIVNDINTNCSITVPNVIVPGSYRDPRFTLNTFDVTCDNGNNGRIALNNQLYGRAPFTYSIIAPSPMGVGTSNSTGAFNNLVGGVYTIRMADSCGGIQTRLVTINNYTWKIDSVVFKKVSCDTAKGYIRVSDNRGNISTIGAGIPGLTYGVVIAPGDTVWSNAANFSFYLNGRSNFGVVVKDACGKIKTAPGTANFTPWVVSTVSNYAFTCNSFSASISGVANFFHPRYCLYDSAGVELACNTTGVFNNLPYGRYCINAHDSCTDTTITRCFTRLAPPISIDPNVVISNKICTSFSAAITGQIGLTNPTYCLYDNSDTQLECNSTGVFNNLSYNNYCIKVKDGCRDTTLVACFSPRKPMPLIADTLLPGYYGCNSFGIVVGGDSLTSPRYCIADSSGAILTCNLTGIFDSLAYGNYCITIHDSCYDTTITRCFGVFGPRIVSNVAINTSNNTCTSFTANISASLLLSPSFCLYNSADSLIECNYTGVFNNLPYGSYCVRTRNSCPDTTFVNCFTESPPLPYLDANVAISNKTCATFSVRTTGEHNFVNPQYCIFDTSGTNIGCNYTGVFNNIPYGNYCIRIHDNCFDTILTRCFVVEPDRISVGVSSSKSCSYGFARLGISVSGGTLPVYVSVDAPDGS